MNIHQLSLNHDVLQDRLLLRINTTAKEELRIWLTRRLALGLQPHLERLGLEAMTPKAAMETPVQTEQARQMMAEFKQQENLSNPRPGWLFKLWRSSHPPLGERVRRLRELDPELARDLRIGASGGDHALVGQENEIGPANLHTGRVPARGRPSLRR